MQQQEAAAVLEKSREATNALEVERRAHVKTRDSRDKLDQTYHNVLKSKDNAISLLQGKLSALENTGQEGPDTDEINALDLPTAREPIVVPKLILPVSAVVTTVSNYHCTEIPTTTEVYTPRSPRSLVFTSRR